MIGEGTFGVYKKRLRGAEEAEAARKAEEQRLAEHGGEEGRQGLPGGVGAREQDARTRRREAGDEEARVTGWKCVAMTDLDDLIRVAQPIARPRGT